MHNVYRTHRKGRRYSRKEYTFTDMKLGTEIDMTYIRCRLRYSTLLSILVLIVSCDRSIKWLYPQLHICMTAVCVQMWSKNCRRRRFLCGPSCVKRKVGD
jgi:hypothetical protein